MCDILLVEDNVTFRRMLEESLRSRYPDAEIDSVETGEKAIQHCERLSPRIVFLDLALPGVGGLQVMEELRAQSAEVVIVVVTGNDIPEYREAAQFKGADFFVSKNTARLEEMLELTGALLGEKHCDKGLSEKFRISDRS